jgi:hypothetical protein
MDHQISTRTQAAEGYLLAELKPSEREEFERHFFDCAECAEDVRDGFLFTEALKAVFREEAYGPEKSVDVPKGRHWLAFITPPQFAPMAAGLAMVVFCGYQNFLQIPALHTRLGQLQRPQVLASAELIPASRSRVPSITIPRGAQFFQLSIAVGVAAPAEKYQCDLRSESGKLAATIPVSTIVPDSNLSLLIPADAVSPGYYEAVLEGISGGVVTKLDHFRFAVRRE